MNGAACADDPTIRRLPVLTEAELHGDLLGLNIASGICYGFNPTAARVWALIETPRSLGAVCAALADEFEVDAASCRSGVAALIDDLYSDGLIEFVA